MNEKAEFLARAEKFGKGSMTGVPTVRKSKKVVIKVSTLRKHLTAVAVITAVITIAGMETIVPAVEDGKYIREAISDYDVEKIVPEKHRTEDNKHYYYDYEDIAQNIIESTDIDMDVYLLVNNMGVEQANRVLKLTELGSYKEYLKKRGFDDEKLFEQYMKDRIVLEGKIADDSRELNELKTDSGDDKTSGEGQMGL